jgi:hypothetical protein
MVLVPLAFGCAALIATEVAADNSMTAGETGDQQGVTVK